MDLTTLHNLIMPALLSGGAFAALFGGSKAYEFYKNWKSAPAATDLKGVTDAVLKVQIASLKMEPAGRHAILETCDAFLKAVEAVGSA